MREGGPSPTARAETAGPQPALYFPTHPGGGGPSTFLEGTLLVRDGCLLVQTDEGVEELVLWPDVVRAEVEGGKVQIVADDGSILAAEGDRISMEGAHTVPEIFVEHTGAPPRECGDSLWYAGMPIERT